MNSLGSLSSKTHNKTHISKLLFSCLLDLVTLTIREEQKETKYPHQRLARLKGTGGMVPCGMPAGGLVGATPEPGLEGTLKIHLGLLWGGYLWEFCMELELPS